MKNRDRKSAAVVLALVLFVCSDHSLHRSIRTGLFRVYVCICQCWVYSSASHLLASCVCVYAYISICLRVCARVP